jgi:hypothetical protein
MLIKEKKRASLTHLREGLISLTMDRRVNTSNTGGRNRRLLEANGRMIKRRLAFLKMRYRKNSIIIQYKRPAFQLS